ncbi:hypothetical protein SOVF_184590 isoform A [Spinacia oleracea]|nr:hypothetical protein SOVF_184590 isoform A [Spinacia oleracea]
MFMLPELASNGEKEWYFYCPRDRKYRNSSRPNRVTCAGFWKATGTDRPIYSSDSAKCIGLKKSLVFYRGRAAKGMKTDWMMHEFRLPSLSDAAPTKKLFDRSFPANDSWAICRIFKKTNTMAQRALSHSWVSALPETTAACDMFNQAPNFIGSQFSPDNISCTTEAANSSIQVCNNNDLQNTTSPVSFSTLDQYKPITNPTVSKVSTIPTSFTDLQNNLIFPTSEVSAMLLNLTPAFTSDVVKITDTIDFGGSQSQQLYNGFPMSLSQNIIEADEHLGFRKSQNQQWNNIRSLGFPFSFPSSVSNSATLSWDSAPCPSELSTSYSSNKCYR